MQYSSYKTTTHIGLNTIMYGKTTLLVEYVIYALRMSLPRSVLFHQHYTENALLPSKSGLEQRTKTNQCISGGNDIVKL